MIEWLSDVIDWLNDNSGAVQAISVVMLAVVTAVYALATLKISSATERQAGASAKMAEEMRVQRLAEDEPLFLMKLLDFNTGGLRPGNDRKVEDCYPANISFEIHNVGSGPAIDVETTFIHPKAHYWRNRREGYVLRANTIKYETSTSIYSPTGNGLSDVLRQCGMPVHSDYEVALVVRYRDIHEREWLAWMALEYEWDVGDGERLIWWLNETGQHRAQLGDKAKACSNAIFAGHVGLTKESH